MTIYTSLQYCYKFFQSDGSVNTELEVQSLRKLHGDLIFRSVIIGAHQSHEGRWTLSPLSGTTINDT